MNSTVTNVTDSEARRQEKNAKTELIINAGKHQRLPRHDTHAWIRTELITNAGEHQRLLRVHVGNQLCPDPGVRVSPR